jgi:hypothetical protein
MNGLGSRLRTSYARHIAYSEAGTTGALAINNWRSAAREISKFTAETQDFLASMY